MTSHSSSDNVIPGMAINFIQERANKLLQVKTNIEFVQGMLKDASS